MNTFVALADPTRGFGSVSVTKPTPIAGSSSRLTTDAGEAIIKTSAGVNFIRTLDTRSRAWFQIPTLLQVHDGTFPEFYVRAGLLGQWCI